MSLFIDKYRPNSLSKLDYHKDQAKKLSQLVHSDDFPHLLVFGPSGAGKKTRIMCLLRDFYGSGVEKRRIEHRTFETPSGKKLEVASVASNYHIELNPSDVGFYDRVIIQEVIKGMAQVTQLDVSSQKRFKTVVLSQVDRLTRDAQHALRRTMEKYTATCRLILCCESTSKLIPALRSRCLCVRVPAPTDADVTTVLNHVCKKEGLKMAPELAIRICEMADGNLRRALLMLETARVQANSYILDADLQISRPDWETYLQETASLIVEEQSPKRLLEIRQRLYELLVHCIPPDVIFKGLLNEVLQNLDSTLKAEVTAQAAFYEYRLEQGSKAIFHLEAFVAKLMVIYKAFLENSVVAMDM